MSPETNPPLRLIGRDPEQAQAVLDGIDQPIYVADPLTYEILYLNAEARRLWGADAIGEPCFRVLRGKTAPCSDCPNDKILGEHAGETCLWEYRNELNNRWYRCADKAILWPDGRTVRYQLAMDISDLKQAHADLAGEQDKVSSFLDNTADLVTIVSRNGAFTYVNKTGHSILGLPPAELRGKSAFDFIHPGDRESTQKAFGQWVAEGLTHVRWENRQVGAHGETRTLSWTIMPKYVEGELESVWSIGHDITALKQAEQKLEARVERRTVEIAQATRVTTAINTLMASALSSATEEQVAKTGLALAEELTGSKFGFVGEVNHQGKFDTIAISNPGWDACRMDGSSATRLIKNMELHGLWSVPLKESAPVVVNTPLEHPAWVGVPHGHPPLLSFLGVPLFQEGRAVGVIALANRAEGYTDTEREAVEALATPLYQMLLRARLEAQARNQAHIKAAHAELAVRMEGDQTKEALSTAIITYLCEWLKVPMGLLFVADDDAFCLTGAYAHTRQDGKSYRYALGEGLVGQVARSGKNMLVSDVPEHFTIQSGLGEMRPRSLFLSPFISNGRVLAIIELALLEDVDDLHVAFLEAVGESIAAALQSALARETQVRLLAASQLQSEELQAQHEELQSANEELEVQAERLKASEEQLRTQQEELRVSNEELAENNTLLERKQWEIEQARQQLAERAEDLALANRYKSEFLANMSHELRSPLNSLLLLAQELSQNREKNLTSDQVESAEIIHQSGTELLALINEILDLSKVEAGRMDIHVEAVFVDDIASSVSKSFGHLAEQKGLAFDVEVRSGAAPSLVTDERRVLQVLKNLVSNAIKFTDEGRVSVTIDGLKGGASQNENNPEHVSQISFAVYDTGAGIPEEKQRIIFEAFRQADSGDSRQYGGSGLGLSISRELAGLLGGEITVESAPGEGSTFRLVLPVQYRESPTSDGHSSPSIVPQHKPTTEATRRTTPIGKPWLADDRDRLVQGEPTVLVIEDDRPFAAILGGQIREHGSRFLAAPTGEEGLQLVDQFMPTGIILDIRLPGMDGWEVLDRLKRNPTTRHIPVHVMSGSRPDGTAQHRGAIGYLQKPVKVDQIRDAIDGLEKTATTQPKNVLVVEKDGAIRRRLVELLTEPEVHVVGAARVAEASVLLRSKSFDCLIVDFVLWEKDSEILVQGDGDDTVVLPPVIVYAAPELAGDEALGLGNSSKAGAIRGIRSEERLLDEVSLFLHRSVDSLSARTREIIRNRHDVDQDLKGKTVLLVDDDMRALFAMSRLLADQGIEVVKANHGQKALDALENDEPVDLVLMDIMMPGLDGYETIKRIRARGQFEKLPVIALTAKAMKGDQAKVMAAGANDYLPKPVDKKRLLSMLRVWLHR